MQPPPQPELHLEATQVCEHPPPQVLAHCEPLQKSLQAPVQVFVQSAPRQALSQAIDVQFSVQSLFCSHSSAQASVVFAHVNEQWPSSGHLQGHSVQLMTAGEPPIPLNVLPPADEPPTLVEPPWPEPPPAPPDPVGTAAQRPKGPPHDQVRSSVVSQRPEAQSEPRRQMLPFEHGLHE